MKHSYLFIVLVFLFTNLSAQKVEVTHSIELFTQGAEKPYVLDVSVFKKESANYIQIHFPEEMISTEYFYSDSSKIKFQTSKMSDDKLVSIQFVGQGLIEEKVEGKFASLVDCVLREDMSGKFILKKK